REIHIGCPDEEAAARMLQFAKDETKPWFAVLHLANTHYPYRVDPALQPYTPHDDSPFEGDDSTPLKNQIRNSVLLQERTMASFYADLKKLPAFDDTVTVFVSDHGEQLREHGALFHLNSLFEEEVRIPGFVEAGKDALTDEQRAALAGFHDRRTYGQDINASMLDLLGAFDARGTFPNGARLTGRSLFRPIPAADPVVAMSTVSGVWYGDRPVYGVMEGETKLLSNGGPWWCFDLAHDPKEQARKPADACPPELNEAAKQRFPDVQTSK
ncbi:MAG TPA: sulfatase-like hydrolase/transferase, partial [Polyangiaceae bacterium]